MTEVQTLRVELAERSYPIYIGAGLLDRPALYRPHIPGRQVCVISNETVAPLYLERVKQALADFELSEIVLPDGEEFKTLDSVCRIWDSLLEARFERSGTLIALGGGVIGDMVGFAAATYQRGVHFIQVPTTLLAQVDSSVGGKTGVNRPLGKNMVGAFYQPRAVLADTASLNTLPDRELKAGLAEVIKYGLINNAAFHDWLSEKLPALLARDANALAYAIHTSCAEKAAVVARDEREGGVRALLNLGHTFGHAIEAAMGYGRWLHGEAVGAGMVMAADLSMRLGMLEPARAAEVKALIAAAGLPVAPPAELPLADWERLMSRDKKAEQGRIRFVLLQAIGQAVVRGDIAPEALSETLTAGAELANPPSATSKSH